MSRYLKRFVFNQNPSFTLKFYKPFSSISHYHDIVPLNYAPNPFFILKNQKIDLTPEASLSDFKQNIQKQYPDIQKINVYEPFTMAEFSEMTPIREIILNDFIFKLNNESFYKIVTAIDLKHFQCFDLQNKYLTNEEKEAYFLMKRLGTSN